MPGRNEYAVSIPLTVNFLQYMFDSVADESEPDEPSTEAIIDYAKSFLDQQQDTEIFQETVDTCYENEGVVVDFEDVEDLVRHARPNKNTDF